MILSPKGPSRVSSSSSSDSKFIKQFNLATNLYELAQMKRNLEQYRGNL
jgi:hypothetical protein